MKNEFSEITYDEYDYEDDLEDNLHLVSDADILANDENFLASFTGDLNQFVSECIVNFFQKKEMYYGGPISEKMILTDHYINTVARSSFCQDVDRAYLALSKSGIQTEAENENLVSDDIRLVIQVLDDCVINRIPKCFRGGIVLMYLEICEGIEII